MNNRILLYQFIFLSALFGHLSHSAVCASEPPILSMKLGFTPSTLYDVDINDARAAQETWLKSVLQNINQSNDEIVVKSIQYPSLSDACKAIEKKEVDALIVLPLEYLSLPPNMAIRPILTSRSGQGAGEHVVLVTHVENNFQSAKQLQNRHLIISTKGDNATPQLWLDTLLLEQALPTSERFFGAIKYVRKTTQAILPVFFKNADACLVPKTDLAIAMQLNPQLANKLQIINESPGFNRIIVCAQNDFHDKFSSRIQNALDIINQTKQGQQLFTLFRVNQMVAFDPAHLDNIKKLVQTYQTLSKTSPLLQNKH